MFARAFGIFCCFCLISYHIPGSSWFVVYMSHHVRSIMNIMWLISYHIPINSKTLNCKHDQRIADRPTAGIEVAPRYQQLLVLGGKVKAFHAW